MMKIAAASLCLALAVTTFSACSSNGNNKPAEESSKPIEEETTTVESTEEPTLEPTQEPTVTAEPTTEPVGNEIIPLFMDLRTDEVMNASPEDFFIYENLIYFFAPVVRLDDKTYSDYALNRFEGSPYSFVVRPQNPEATERTTLEIYFYNDNTGEVRTYYETDNDQSGTLTFMPLFYDQADQSLVGFYSNKKGVYTFVKLYYNPISDVFMTTEVNRADYF